MIRLVFLGRLADVAGMPTLDLPAETALPLAAILAALDPALAAALAAEKIRLALNGVLIAREGLRAGPGDELAFLPPVSGG